LFIKPFLLARAGLSGKITAKRAYALCSAETRAKPMKTAFLPAGTSSYGRTKEEQPEKTAFSLQGGSSFRVYENVKYA
jgi:hypothetical protein